MLLPALEIECETAPGLQHRGNRRRPSVRDMGLIRKGIDFVSFHNFSTTSTHISEAKFALESRLSGCSSMKALLLSTFDNINFLSGAPTGSDLIERVGLRRLRRPQLSRIRTINSLRNELHNVEVASSSTIHSFLQYGTASSTPSLFSDINTIRRHTPRLLRRCRYPPRLSLPQTKEQ